MENDTTQANEEANWLILIKQESGEQGVKEILTNDRGALFVSHVILTCQSYFLLINIRLNSFLNRVQTAA